MGQLLANDSVNRTDLYSREMREYFTDLVIQNWHRDECKIQQNVSKDIRTLIMKYSAPTQYEKLLHFMVLKWKINQKEINGFEWKVRNTGTYEDEDWSFRISFGETKKYYYKFSQDYPDMDRGYGYVENCEIHNGTFAVNFNDANTDKPDYILCKGKGTKHHGTPGANRNNWEGEYKFYLSRVDALKPIIF
eukprot:137225_1